MKKTKKLTGRMLALEFKDHAHFTGHHKDDVKALSCQCMGFCFKEDEDSYYLATWISDGEVDHNSEIYVILKSVVTKIKVLK